MQVTGRGECAPQMREVTNGIRCAYTIITTVSNGTGVIRRVIAMEDAMEDAIARATRMQQNAISGQHVLYVEIISPYHARTEYCTIQTCVHSSADSALLSVTERQPHSFIS